MNEMLVYHGTNCLFDQIDLSKSKKHRDFGIGFYTTTLIPQAEIWARYTKDRRNGGESCIYEYLFQPTDDLQIKVFDAISVDWLDFIAQNRRSSSLAHQFDVVIGPVADDDTMTTVIRYMAGTYTQQEALERLRFKKTTNQVSFHTQQAVNCLSLQRRYSLDS
jgi:hypothetical protein